MLHVCTTLSSVIKNILCCILIGFYCLLEYLIISTFDVNSTHCGKQFDPEAQLVCIGCQRTLYADVHTAWYQI